eukprot:9459897-Karenia_brevis.AAC.1
MSSHCRGGEVPRASPRRKQEGQLENEDGSCARPAGNDESSFNGSVKNLSRTVQRRLQKRCHVAKW